jgi:hypothetical protein
MEISTGTLTREDLQETAGNQEHGVLYPVIAAFRLPVTAEIHTELVASCDRDMKGYSIRICRRTRKGGYVSTPETLYR